MIRLNPRRVGWVGIVLVCASVGLLMPPESQAGHPDKKLNKHCEKVPTWRGVIPGKKRFVPTFKDENRVPQAYCDRQTGLVWETVPSTEPIVWGSNEDPSSNATDHCLNLLVGPNGQKGWRLPSVVELASLVETTSTSCTVNAICLPDGHPFDLPSASVFWSATEVAGDSNNAWAVSTGDGNVTDDLKTEKHDAWCVRGAMNAAVY